MMKRTNGIVLGLLLIAGLCGPFSAAGQGLIEKSHSQPRFNTRTHISNLDCNQCHGCEMPTREEPCLVDCPRHMGHFQTDSRPGDGPEVVIIGDLAHLYDPVPFAHKLHAAMSDLVGGCENCHHYSEPGGVIPPCGECHGSKQGEVTLNKPSLQGAYHRQCLNCHLDWLHENSCNFCHQEHHEEMAVATPDTTDILGVKHPMIEAVESYSYDTTYDRGPVVTFHHADHVDQFGLNCVDCHRGESCSGCHDRMQTTMERVRDMTSCTTCHAERGCGFCHDYQEKPRFEHGSSTGWDLGKRHAKLDCRDCHGVPKVFHTPSTTCISCHESWLAGDFDHSVTGVVFNEDHTDLDCADCHLEENFEDRPTCDGCHDDGRHYAADVKFGD